MLVARTRKSERDGHHNLADRQRHELWLMWCCQQRETQADVARSYNVSQATISRLGPIPFAVAPAQVEAGLAG